MPKKSLKHLPEAEWPPADRDLFATAFRADGDLFDGRGPGSHLRPRTVASIHYGYRRWLGWLAAFHPSRSSPAGCRPDYAGASPKIRQPSATDPKQRVCRNWSWPSLRRRPLHVS